MNDITDVPFGSDLFVTHHMLEQAGVAHRFWRVNERENGERFRGFSLTFGTENAVGPYVELTYDSDGKLVTAEPVQQEETRLIICRTTNENHLDLFE